MSWLEITNNGQYLTQGWEDSIELVPENLMHIAISAFTDHVCNVLEQIVSLPSGDMCSGLWPMSHTVYSLNDNEHETTRLRFYFVSHNELLLCNTVTGLNPGVSVVCFV